MKDDDDLRIGAWGTVVLTLFVISICFGPAIFFARYGG